MEQKENLTKEYIYKAFFILLESKNYDDISVSEITEKAGVSRMSFYRNFKSKDDLIFQGLDRIVSKIKVNLSKYPKITIYAITKAFFDELKGYQKCYQSIANSPISRQLTLETISRLKTEIPMDCINKTTKYIPIFYFGAICVTMVDWLRNGATETPEEMAKMIATLVNFDPPDQKCNNK